MPRDDAAPRGRPYVGVHFRCCNVYRRVYLNAQRTRFEGHCPRCGARCSMVVSEAGSSSRFWRVG